MFLAGWIILVDWAIRGLACPRGWVFLVGWISPAEGIILACRVILVG